MTPDRCSSSRSAYARRQRQEHGRRALAVLPIVYPKELLTALDVLAVELWGPPGPPRGDAAGRIQPYVCAVVRNALSFLASGGADAVDGVLFPHTCDSIQGLATLLRDLGGWERPTFVFQPPRASDGASARAYLAAELRALARGLGAWLGRELDPARLGAAIRLHAELDATRAALLGGRARLAMTDVELYATLRRGEWLWPEDHLAELRAAAARLGAHPAQDGVPVLVTGYVPEPAALLGALGAAGAYVAADDYAAVGRRLPVAGASPADPGADPFQALAARVLALPPCPTRGGELAARVRHLEALAERSGARGVLVHVQRFCEPELFDVPAIRRAFSARGVSVLVLDGELERELPAQAATRIEAFVEMLDGGRRVA